MGYGTALNDDTYLVHPYIRSLTKAGKSYDFRLHVQKNGEGRWVTTAVYPRIAEQGVIANLSQGGYTSFLDSFLEMQFGEESYNMKRYLEIFSLQFSNHFDSLYENKLDELGIDVGIDENQKIWLFEVNWRPGVLIIFNLEIDIVKTTIKYAVYLAQRSKKVK